MSVIGHNNGPAMGQGRGWRTYCWRAARRELLPHMPLNVVRRRVKRAAELGLAYPAYARIHATAGRDILAFLFSTNALQIIRDTDPLPGDRAEFLNAQQACATLSLAHPPLEPDSVARRLSLATGREVTARRAPPAFANWAEVRAAVSRLRRWQSACLRIRFLLSATQRWSVTGAQPLPWRATCLPIRSSRSRSDAPLPLAIPGAPGYAALRNCRTRSAMNRRSGPELDRRCFFH